jgi:predicted lipoprotein with Yx(FWY)xxD motif
LAKKHKLLSGALIIGMLPLAGVAAASVLSGTSASARTVKTGHVLGKTVLVTPKGMTLYSLSAETRGRFICTDKTCLSLWHPLVVKRGTRPTGASHLSTIRRPDGRTQVRYRGKPLYTFVEDKRPGQAKGEGFRDVGTWHVASTGSTAKQSPTMPTQTTPTYPNGY